MSLSFGRFMTGFEATGFRGVIAPADEETDQQFASVQGDHVYQLKFQREMHPKFKRMVERAIRDCYENQERYESEEVHRTAVKLAIGWVYDEPVIRGGETHWVVRKLDFYNCKQSDLEAFWELLKPYILEHLGEAGLNKYQGSW